MFKAYQTRWGIYFSLFIAILSSIVRLIQLDAENLLVLFLNVVYTFSGMLISWHIHQYFINHQHFIRGRAKTVLSILTAMCVIVFSTWLSKIDASLLFLYKINLTGKQIEMLIIFRSALISGINYFVVYILKVNLQLQQSKLENEHLKQESLRAQLFSLQQQVSPHFLFNSLSTLKTMVPDKETKTYVMQLANVYRYLLTFHDHQRITLKEELGFLTSYLYILQERFEEALQVDVEVREDLLYYYIPPISLQILIENAVKHNIISVDEPLQIRVFTDSLGNLVVNNTYQPKFSVEDSNGKGLQNINERYRLLAGKQIDITTSESKFTVTLPLLMP
jgi:two-component system, LytTR family, sensor kinase